MPLILLLIGLVVLLEIMQPGIVNVRWLGNTIKFAIPLAMLAACQTLTMLTGGIDLSAGTVATIAAFVDRDADAPDRRACGHRHRACLRPC